MMLREIAAASFSRLVLTIAIEVLGVSPNSKSGTRRQSELKSNPQSDAPDFPYNILTLITGGISVCA